MAGAAGRWFLNNTDVFTAYGLAVQEGQAGFLNFPKLKDTLSHDWPEENGTDSDLSSPRFHDKEVRLKCVFLAPDKATFEANRSAFFANLSQPGWQSWRIDDHDHTYAVHYRESANFKLTTKRLKAVEMVVATFDLVLRVSEELPENTDTSGEPVLIKAPDGTILASINPGGEYTVAYLTQVHGGLLSQGDEQYDAFIGSIKGEPL